MYYFSSSLSYNYYCLFLITGKTISFALECGLFAIRKSSVCCDQTVKICSSFLIRKTQDLWVKLGTLGFSHLKGHLSPWLVSKQSTLSSHLCSKHIGSIATLSSMATTRSVVRVRWGLSVRACCVINSSNVLSFVLNPLGWLTRINIHVNLTLVWSIRPFCFQWCFISSMWKVQH